MWKVESIGRLCPNIRIGNRLVNPVRWYSDVNQGGPLDINTDEYRKTNLRDKPEYKKEYKRYTRDYKGELRYQQQYRGEYNRDYKRKQQQRQYKGEYNKDYNGDQRQQQRQQRQHQHKEGHNGNYNPSRRPYPNNSKRSHSSSHKSQPKQLPSNVPIVQFSQGNSSIKIPIQINPQLVKSFEDLKLNESILKSLYQSYPNISTPTEIQKKMLALLKSDVSVMVKSDSGTGKSLSTILYMMSYNRIKPKDKNPYITNLIIVPSPQLAAQYYKHFQNIVKNMPDVNIHNVVQRLFRSEEGDFELSNKQQENLLREYPGCHTLIATPNRLLDYLSSENRNLIPLYNTSCIALDEVDALYWKELIEKESDSTKSDISKRKKNSKQTPVDLLMNHIKSWRDGYLYNIMKRNYPKDKDIKIPPLRMILTSSVDFKGFDRMVESKPWLKDNIRPILTVGVNSSLRGVVYEMPKRVNSYFVKYDDSKKEVSDFYMSDIAEGDIIKSDIAQGDITESEIIEGNIIEDKSSNCEPTAAKHKEDKNSVSISTSKQSSASTHPTLSSPSIASSILQKYSNCLLKLVKHESPSLIILPDGISSTNLAELLESNHFKCALANITSPTGFSSVQNTPVDPSNCFSSTTDIIISQTSNIHGIIFPGLKNIYILDWHLIYPKILYTKLAGLGRGDEISIYLINTVNDKKSLEVFKSSIASIEGLTMKSIK